MGKTSQKRKGRLEEDKEKNVEKVRSRNKLLQPQDDRHDVASGRSSLSRHVCSNFTEPARSTWRAIK